MKRALGYLIVLGLIGLGIAWWLSAPQTLAASDLPNHTADPVKGERIFNVAGCASCHAAPGAKGEDKLALAGGHRFETEFGTFVAPNISPDTNAGIGGWSELDFVNAVVRGVSPNGAHYYPAFPYGSYRAARLPDVLDMKAYMDTLPAVAEASPPNEVGFPFNIRRTLGLWKLVFQRGDVYEVPAGADAQVTEGAYLVNALGHCGECHTPRNPVGGLLRDKAFAGGPNPDGKGFIPNITPHADGLASWSTVDIAFALESGFTPDFDSLGGSMAPVVENTGKLPAADREAMAAYLKSVPALPNTPRPDAE